ncbi:MAG: hypothetical protein AB1428_08300 [Bacteroidota bacterium]
MKDGKLKIVYLVLFIVTAASGTAVGADGSEARCRRLLDVVSGEQERSFYSIAAKLATRRDTATAYRMLDSMTIDKAVGGNFYSYTLIGTYLHSRSHLPDSLHRKVRDAYRLRTMYRGDTENHWVTYYSGIYLAAQTWPGEDGTRWFNGRSSTENFREAEEWLTRWMMTTATIGQGEFDSPTYMTVFIAPLLVLYDFAADTVMKRRAQMTLDLLFADVAVDHLMGNYCGGHSRDYPEDIINPLGAPMTRVTWLYFGEPAEERWDDARFRPRYRGSWESVFGALSSYRLPPVIERIALDRSKPYVHYETKRVRNIIRFGKQVNPPVYKYLYMTSNYALGSLQGGILQPIQQHTWDVTFVSGKPNNTIFTLHPFYSGRELAMFFPEEIKFLSGEVDRYHKVYTSPDKWNSSSPYEQTFQHRNAIIVLYNIAPAALQQHIDGFFPGNLDERTTDPSGWIFCRAGETYVGFFPLKKYEWIREGDNWRWRSHELKNGIVLEAGSAAEDASFATFCAKLKKSVPSFSLTGGRPAVLYTTRHRDRMEFQFDGARLLNGHPISFSTYGFYRGPFINSTLKSGVITLTAGGLTRVLDFNTVTIHEK